MSDQYEIRLSGSGGQGLILGGIILAEAALRDNKNAIQSQSYGPEARGGASKAEVIISTDEINYPKVRKCDTLLSLTQKACDEYIDTIKDGGILVIDNEIVPKKINNIKIYKVPMVQIALEKINNPLVTNIVALGVLNEIIKIVSNESLKEAVLKRVPKGTIKLNEKALEEGSKMAKNILEQ